MAARASIQHALDGALHAQRLLPGLIVMIVALFLGKAAQGAHGVPHDGILHPLGEMLGIELFTVFEEF